MTFNRQPSQPDGNSGAASKQEILEAFRSASAKHPREPRRQMAISGQAMTNVTCKLCNFTFQLSSGHLGHVSCPACGMQFEVKNELRFDSIHIEQIEQELERIRKEIRESHTHRHQQREKSILGPVPMQTVKKSFASSQLTPEQDIDASDGNSFYRMIDRVRSEIVYLEKEQRESFLRWQASLKNRKAEESLSAGLSADTNRNVDTHDNPSATKADSVSANASTNRVPPAVATTVYESAPTDDRVASDKVVNNRTIETSFHTSDETFASKKVTLQASLAKSQQKRYAKRIRVALVGIALVLICFAAFPLIGHLQTGRNTSDVAKASLPPTSQENVNADSATPKSTANHIPQEKPSHLPSKETATGFHQHEAHADSAMSGNHSFGSIVFNANGFSNNSQTVEPSESGFAVSAGQPTALPEDIPLEGTTQHVVIDRQLHETQAQLNEVMQQYERTRQNNEHLERVAKQNEAESLLWEAYAHTEKDPIRSMVLSLKAIESFKELGLEIPSAAKWALNQSLVSQKLGISLNGFQGGVNAMTLSNDGQWFLFAGDNGAIWLWDIAKHDQTAGSFQLDNIHDGVSQLLMTSNTELGICVTRSGMIRLWNLKLPIPSEKPIDIADARCHFTRIVLSDDGHWLAAYGQSAPGQGHEVFLWDLKHVMRHGTVPPPIILKGHEKPIHSLAISNNSKWLVSGSEDCTVRVYDLKTAYPAAEQIVLKGHELAVHCVAVSPDGNWLVTGGRDSVLRIWNLQTRQSMATPIQFQEHEGWISTLAFSRDGRCLASGSYDNTIRLWRMHPNDPPEVAHVLTGHIGPVKSVEFSRQGNQLLSLGLDREVRLWDLDQGNPSENVLAFRSSQVPFSSAMLSGNGDWLILAQKKPNGPGQSGLRLWPMQFREAFQCATSFAAANFPELYQRQNTPESVAVYQEERIAQSNSSTHASPHVSDWSQPPLPEIAPQNAAIEMQPILQPSMNQNPIR